MNTTILDEDQFEPPSKDAPFKGPVGVATFVTNGLCGFYCYDGDGRRFTLNHFGLEGQNKCLAIAATLNAYSPERDAEARLAKARLSARSKTIITLRHNLSNIVNGLEDDGDRVYFGSSNDADELRNLYDELQAWEWAKIASDVVADDPYAASRKAHAELNQLREQTAEREKAVQELVDELHLLIGFLENAGFTTEFLSNARAKLAAYEASK